MAKLKNNNNIKKLFSWVLDNLSSTGLGQEILTNKLDHENIRGWLRDL